jgi:hypothetical protein
MCVFARAKLQNMLGVASAKFVAPTIGETMERCTSTRTNDLQDVIVLVTT